MEKYISFLQKYTYKIIITNYKKFPNTHPSQMLLNPNQVQSLNHPSFFYSNRPLNYEIASTVKDTVSQWQKKKQKARPPGFVKERIAEW